MNRARETAKEEWNLIESEYYGSEKSRHTKVWNLRRESEVLKISEPKILEQYSDSHEDCESVKIS